MRSLASFIWSVATWVYRSVVVTLVWPRTCLTQLTEIGEET